MRYAIYLISPDDITGSNDYGYWAGESYKVQGELFPVTDNKITDRTRLYKSRVRAETAMTKCINTFCYVRDAEIKEVIVWEGKR